MGDVLPIRPGVAQPALPGVEPPPPAPARAYGMTVAEWHDRAEHLRAAGLVELGDFYAENALRLSRGEPVLWPPPAALKASALLAQKPGPDAFVDDAREP